MEWAKHLLLRDLYTTVSPVMAIELEMMNLSVSTQNLLPIYSSINTCNLYASSGLDHDCTGHTCVTCAV